MASDSTRTLTFVLSLIGGLVIIAGSLIMVLFWNSGFPYRMYYGMGPGMMGGYWFGSSSGWMLGLFIIALISGVIVLIGAIMLNARPQERVTWGIVVIVFAIISLVGMGGYIIGALLGIAGGAIALSYRMRSTAQKESSTAS